MEFEIACQSNLGRLLNGGLTLASESWITHNEMVEGWNATMTEAKALAMERGVEPLLHDQQEA